tara:strand:- start:475 stop:807 length:333 start_codon:yes stop_codon:yes gene_type:complete
MQIEIKIKPLSINKAFQGRRFKTPYYKAYEQELMLRLPSSKVPLPPFSIAYEFGFSNMASDIDNPVKALQDVMQKKYKFNDKDIMEARIKKVIVKKGDEYIKVEMTTLKQ